MPSLPSRRHVPDVGFRGIGNAEFNLLTQGRLKRIKRDESSRVRGRTEEALPATIDSGASTFRNQVVDDRKLFLNIVIQFLNEGLSPRPFEIFGLVVGRALTMKWALAGNFRPLSETVHAAIHLMAVLDDDKAIVRGPAPGLRSEHAAARGPDARIDFYPDVIEQ